jgi:hypothetical protein
VQPPQRKDRQSRQHQFRRARHNRDPRSRRLRSQNPSAALRAKIDLNKTHSAVNIARLPELLGKADPIEQPPKETIRCRCIWCECGYEFRARIFVIGWVAAWTPGLILLSYLAWKASRASEQIQKPPANRPEPKSLGRSGQNHIHDNAEWHSSLVFCLA